MEYTLTFTEQELNLLSSALVELPFKVVAPLIQKISEQVAQANAPAEEKPAPVVEKPAK